MSTSTSPSTNEATEARRRPKDRKQQILVAARDLFVEQGFPNVTMSLIAERVGITAGALYRHFANKSVLLEAAVRDGFGDLAPPSGEEASLEAALAEAMPRAAARPYLSVLWAREARHLPQETYDEVRELLRRSTRGYVRLLRSQRPGLPADQTELLAWAILSIMGSLANHSTRLPPDELAELLICAAVSLCRADLVPRRAPRTRTEPKLQPFSRRERLLVAATQLFAEKGYQAASMGDIGAAADVTGPNLYGYFESKAAILLAVVERCTHALWLQLDGALDAHDTPRDALGAVVAGYVELSRTWAGLGGQRPSGEAEVEARAKLSEREYVAEWTSLVTQSRPELDQRSARVLVHAALGVIHDLSSTPHLSADGSFAENATSMALAVLDS